MVAENPQRVAFGADFSSADNKATAAYAIFPAGSINTLPGNETPERAVATWLTQMGTVRIRFGQRQQVAPNIFFISYEAAAFQGAAYYQVFPAGRGGYMVLMRTANTRLGAWQSRGAEASAAARSAHCQVPNVPTAADPPSLNAKVKSGEGDSLYNRWLEKEYYHNSETGENFWVSPSQDWNANGPSGAGYYAPHGNGLVKLEPGYSR